MLVRLFLLVVRGFSSVADHVEAVDREIVLGCTRGQEMVRNLETIGSGKYRIGQTGRETEVLLYLPERVPDSGLALAGLTDRSFERDKRPINNVQLLALIGHQTICEFSQILENNIMAC